MTIIRRGGTWFFKRRVPRRFAHVDPREFVRVSLHTDSEALARRKAAEVEAAVLARWEALAAGAGADVVDRYDATVRLAAARGFVYRTAAELAAGPLEDLVARLEALAAGGRLGAAADADALLGEVERPRLTLSDALADFYALAADRLDGKSETQAHRWRLPRERAVRNFVAAIGDKRLDEITRQDALDFRAWWRARVVEGLDSGSANKDFGHLSDLFRTVSEMRALGLDNPFARLRFREKGRTDVPAFSTKWIRERLLAPGALAGLGEEARSVLLVMVNTGARPSEITGARPEDLVLGGKVPFLRIAAHDGRGLKTDHSRRDVPLVGVSLEAARVLRSIDPRRYTAADGWSATVNKFLRVNKLRETPDHTAYSLRHAFQDRLIAVEAPERIQAELMGHKLARPRYGEGATLEHKARWIQAVAL